MGALPSSDTRNTLTVPTALLGSFIFDQVMKMMPSAMMTKVINTRNSLSHMRAIISADIQMSKIYCFLLSVTFVSHSPMHILVGPGKNCDEEFLSDAPGQYNMPIHPRLILCPAFGNQSFTAIN